MNREAIRLAAGAAVLGVLGLFVALRLRVVTDVSHFLPDGEPGAEVELARELAAGELGRTMVLLLSSPDGPAALRAGRELERELRADPAVAGGLEILEGGPPPDFEEELWRLYEPRRFAFLAPDAAAARAATSAEALAAAVTRLRERLALPISGLVSRIAPGDPLLILPDLIERFASERGGRVEVLDGRYATGDGAAVLFLRTRAPASDARLQRPLLAGIHAAFERVQASTVAPLELAASGTNRFAVSSEAAIRADIERVSIGSLLGLALALWTLFRSLRLALLILPVVSAGFLAGASACLLLFGAVHGLTLAFGAALIGVSVDYPVHFYCHELLAPDPRGPRSTLARIWRGLKISAATTIVGFLALLASGFAGLRELAVFGAAGVTAALVATRVFLPGLVGRPQPSRATRWLFARIAAATAPRARPRLMAWIPAGLAVLVSLVGLPGLRWNDALRDLNGVDPDLVAEEEHVRTRLLGDEPGGIVVAVGADEEHALQRNDEIARVLEEARADGLVDGWRSLAGLLPSAERQRAVDAAVRGDAGLWPRSSAELAAQGFRAESFAPFRDALAAPPPEPLTLRELEASALALLARPFRVSLGEGVGLVSHLHGVRDFEALRARLARIEGAHLIDLEATLSEAYGAYRERMGWLLGFGLVAMLALVFARHRAVRPTLTAFLPALLAVSSTLAALSLAGVDLNLLTLVALLMVGCMGDDYGVLLIETRDDEQSWRASFLSILVAGSTTIFGFGLLAFSDQPALFSLGSTAALGVLMCIVIAPTLGLAMSPGARSGTPGRDSDRGEEA